MIAEIVAVVLNLLVVEPLTKQVQDRLTAAGASRETLDWIAECGRTAPPLVAERALSEPVWAVETVIKVWLGSASAESVLAELSPSCSTQTSRPRPSSANLQRQA